MAFIYCGNLAHLIHSPEEVNHNRLSWIASLFFKVESAQRQFIVRMLGLPLIVRVDVQVCPVDSRNPHHIDSRQT